ncbi:MAG: hypothetical protein LBN39_09190 [Planctomycetaceae bacterium]|nr:hypothetical protein [Planctomycetaceae bacterium]
MSDIPAPQNLEVGFSLTKDGTHTFALEWKMNSSRKTIRYSAEFSVDKRTFFPVPPELCRIQPPPTCRIDIPFSDFVKLFQEQTDAKGKKLDIRGHRYIYWQLTAVFHDTADEKVFGQSKSSIAYFEMPVLE